MPDTIKAVRGLIDLGGISLSVYMIPSGRYLLAGRNVTDAIDEASNSLLRIMGVKSLKGLPNASPSLIQVKANTGESFIPVSPLDASMYWGKMTAAGNRKAQAILVALSVDSIERRADAVFGVHRTEDERNRRVKTLIDSILADPKTWTMHFKPQWQREACRVTGYHWHPSRPMAQFISTYIYKALPKDVYQKLIVANASRRARHHQFFDDVADEIVLKEHIQQVGGILRVARNKQHFKQLFADAFGSGVQGDFELDEIAS